MHAAIKSDPPCLFVHVSSHAPPGAANIFHANSPGNRRGSKPSKVEKVTKSSDKSEGKAVFLE